MINQLKSKRHILMDIGLFLFLLIFIIILGQSFISIIRPFIYALVVAYILNPVVNSIEKRKVKRVFAILIVFFSIFIIVSSAFAIIIPRFSRDISEFVSEEIPKILNFVNRIIDDFRAGELWILPEVVYDYINIDSELERITEVIGDSFSELSTAIVESTGTLLDIVLTPIISFYYLKDKDTLIKSFMRLINNKAKEKLVVIAGEINVVLGGFIRGQLIVAAFVGILTGVGCKIIGVPNSLTIGLVAGVTNIIPYFGPWIGGILPVVLAMMDNPITALWVIILIVVVQQVESSFISPQVMSRSVGLHPLAVMFSVLLFGNAFGIIGMIIGVPLTATAIVVFKHVMDFRKSLREKFAKK
ncbi:AI-2E family transporter [Herbivorax sp. ANBcel31]|uniref:AI-2E family transporter n=1 Tax=Herbivorax sp. ANBcel31 TaxID=3069754 RepID=UPI0027AFBA4D|nr:AI-2E family transporter [Herbivorax sp. ANBcel31]MDQ2084860.1 AI-2E family transporter [Herbivorax sp. ANBcel31]